MVWIWLLLGTPIVRVGYLGTQATTKAETFSLCKSGDRIIHVYETCVVAGTEIG